MPCGRMPSGLNLVLLEADRLDVELAVQNTGEHLAFTAALHSYLRVVQVEDVTLEGLRGQNTPTA